MGRKWKFLGASGRRVLGGYKGLIVQGGYVYSAYVENRII